MEIQEWKQEGEDEVLQAGYGKRFVRRRFTNPDTKEVVDFLLFGRRNGAIVFPVTEEGKVIVVRQSRQGVKRIMFELPAGTAQSDEELTKTGLREMLEETGYEPNEFISTCSAVCLDATNSWVEDQTFLALGCRFVPEKRSPRRENEPIEVVLMSVEEWLAYAFGGEPMDSGSVAATLYAIPHLLRRGLITTKTFE